MPLAGFPGFQRVEMLCSKNLKRPDWRRRQLDPCAERIELAELNQLTLSRGWHRILAKPNRLAAKIDSGRHASQNEPLPKLPLSRLEREIVPGLVVSQLQLPCCMRLAAHVKRSQGPSTQSCEAM